MAALRWWLSRLPAGPEAGVCCVRYGNMGYGNGMAPYGGMGGMAPAAYGGGGGMAAGYAPAYGAAPSGQSYGRAAAGRGASRYRPY